jgi:hypothetical protein
MTVWVFGDSFAEHYPGLKEQWMQRVTNELKTDIVSFGLSASSVEYTYQKFNLIRNKIKENDVVIVALTSYQRRWFFKYYPGDLVKIYNPGGFDDYKEYLKAPSGNPKEEEALIAYADNLNHKELQEIYLLNFLYNLDYITKKLNLHTIVLINLYDINQLMKDKKDLFSKIHFSENMMLDIYLKEFTKEHIINNALATMDPRVNHMIKSNHIILANKILDNIKNNTPIDLGAGFVENVINEKTLEHQQFINDELFFGFLNKIKKL